MKRTCPYCAEEVMAAAKICPRCRNWLSIYSLRNPIFFMGLVCLFFVMSFIGFMATMRQIMNPGRDFSTYQDSISVVESRMNFQPDYKGDTMVYVVVVLTNKSDLAWKNPQLDLRYYNRAGMLIDADNYGGYGTIYPHSEMALRARDFPNHALQEYDSCKVSVRSADDPKKRF